MFLLDTNVISELRRRSRMDAGVRTWAASVPHSANLISVVTVEELERGTLLMERRDPTQGAILRRWIEIDVLQAFVGRVLPVDTEIARRCAALHVPDPRPNRDALIAATALVHGLTVVTRNTRDFEPMRVPVLNPWLTPQL